MVKGGCQKKIVVLKSPESELFDEAYFILKENFPERSSDDIVAEANRLVCECTGVRKKRFFGRFNLFGVFCFASGAGISAAVTLALALADVI